MCWRRRYAAAQGCDVGGAGVIGSPTEPLPRLQRFQCRTPELGVDRAKLKQEILDIVYQNGGRWRVWRGGAVQGGWGCGGHLPASKYCQCIAISVTSNSCWEWVRSNPSRTVRPCL